MNIIVISERNTYENFEGLFNEVDKAEEYIKKDIEENPCTSDRYTIWRVYKNRPEEGLRLVKSRTAYEWAKVFTTPEEADPVDSEEVY